MRPYTSDQQLWSDNERLSGHRDAVTATLRDTEHAQARLQRLKDAMAADEVGLAHCGVCVWCVCVCAFGYVGVCMWSPEGMRFKFHLQTHDTATRAPLNR